MRASSIRSLVPFVIGGLVVGGTLLGLGWGLLPRTPQSVAEPVRPAEQKTEITSETPVVTSATPKLADETEPEASPTPEVQQPKEVVGGPAEQTPDNSEVYKKFPDLPRPTINLDGRDMTAEAARIAEMPAHSSPVAFPGTSGLPTRGSTPLPFPKTIEEANQYQRP